MPIPEFLLRKLFVRDSLADGRDGFSFALLNSLASAHITSLTIAVDGAAIPAQAVLLRVAGSTERAATSVTPADPYLLPVGVAVSIFVRGTRLGARRLTIRGVTREAGAIAFTVRPGRDAERAEDAEPPEHSPAGSTRFTPRDWERIRRDWSAWWAGELQRPLAVVVGMEASDYSEVLQNYPVELSASQVLARNRGAFEAAQYYGDAFPRWWPNLGPGIMAAFLGSGVRAEPETAWFTPAGDAPIGDLNPAYDTHNPWWLRVQEFTRAAVATWGERVAVGLTDLGGTLDVLASLRGTHQLLLDLHDSPADVERLMKRLTGLWLRYFGELCALVQPAGHGVAGWGPCWAPGPHYMLQSDFAYMISPRMFERFVLPGLEACCTAMPYPLYHLDGVGQIPHLDMLLSVQRLRGIQWVPGEGKPPAQEWLPLLKRIRDAGKLCYVDVSRAGALQIARALGGTGFLFRIDEHLEEDEARQFLQLLAQTGAQQS
jgi:hypothetical protein